jgi:hypothetical protein
MLQNRANEMQSTMKVIMSHLESTEGNKKKQQSSSDRAWDQSPKDWPLLNDAQQQSSGKSKQQP